MEKKIQEKQIQEKLIKTFENKAKSFVTLNYPPEIYPPNEIEIKNHLSKFIDGMRKLTKKEKSYFYAYELQEKNNNNINIHILTQAETDKELFLLKKKWTSIICTTKEEALHFKKLDENALSQFCGYILKIIDNKEQEKILIKKLGKSTRFFGGSKEFQPLLKELRDNNIDMPITFSSLSKELSLTEIRKELKNQHLHLTEEQIDAELSIELISFTQVYNTLQYQNLEKFLMTGKSEISKGYLKFYNFIKELSNELFDSFKEEVCQWSQEKTRRTELVNTFRKAFNFIDNEQEARYLLMTSLDYMLKSAIRGISKITIIENLGKIIIKKSVINDESEEILKEEELIKYNNNLERIGSLLYLIIQKICKGKIEYQLIEKQKTSEEEIDEIDNEINNISNFQQETEIKKFNFSISVNIDNNWFSSLKYDKIIKKSDITKLIKLTSPMLVEPKDWVTKNEKLHYVKGIENRELFNASKITNGGYLLNGYYFNKPIQKNVEKGHKHNLAISKNSLNTVNKIQKIKYEVNQEQLRLLKKYISYTPDYLNSQKLKEIIKNRNDIKKKLASLYQEKENHKEGYNINAIIKNINNCKDEIEELSGLITKSELQHRLLNDFTELQKNEYFYYSYDLDFRMRLYAQQTELSPQGSKLSRSLIKFKEKVEFNLIEFSLYVTRLYTKIYEFTELELYTMFHSKVEHLLNNFIKNEEEAIKEIFKDQGVAEPYLFLAACIEYKNYKTAEEKGEKYYTGFPIILDCSGSGPQILSLLFLLEDFSKFLNLEPNETRKDFYICVIKKFLELEKEENLILEKIQDKLNSSIESVSESVSEINYTKEEESIIEKITKNFELKNSRKKISQRIDLLEEINKQKSDSILLKEKINQSELLTILRGICKQSIMTQVYKVSYRKYSNDIEKGFRKKKEILKHYFIISDDVEGYNKFIHVFKNKFWTYLHNLPLYKFNDFFMQMIDELKKNDKSLSWFVLNESYINVQYQKEVKLRKDFKEHLIGRFRYSVTQYTTEKNYRKLKSSAQAHFIHSLDAYVNMSTLEQFNGPIFPIHDAWGVQMGKSEDLKALIRVVYYKLSYQNLVLKQLIADFVKIITETVSEEAGESFRIYCEKNLKPGNYDPTNLFNCKYMVYF